MQGKCKTCCLVIEETLLLLQLTEIAQVHSVSARHSYSTAAGSCFVFGAGHNCIQRSHQSIREQCSTNSGGPPSPRRSSCFIARHAPERGLVPDPPRHTVLLPRRRLQAPRQGVWRVRGHWLPGRRSVLPYSSTAARMTVST